jgi:mannose-6-phosphate isomerase-like protein (cupin superfamily)
MHSRLTTQEDPMRAFLACAVLALSGAVSAPAAAEAVTYIPAEMVTAAFAKGVPLVETAEYKVHASRRETPGQAEVHTKDTDIIYVLQGGATFVTGGTVVDGKTTAPEEIRGREITGGETRQIAKGDVVIVPAGTPHWFKAVDAPLLYYVVKAH